MSMDFQKIHFVNDLDNNLKLKILEIIISSKFLAIVIEKQNKLKKHYKIFLLILFTLKSYF